MTLSVCLIVKDEEEVIGRCLNCAIKFADEIIVVDTGSTDNTVQEAKKYTDEIYFYKWNDDFSAARNYAFEKASCDFLMWLDADDVITDKNGGKIKALVKDADFDMAFLPYATAFENGRATFVYYRERIFRRSKNYRFSGAVHEAVVPRGNIVYADAVVYHKKVKSGDPMRNLKIYQKQIAGGIRLDGRAKFYYGRELFYNGMLLESAAVLEDFLKGDGWVENKIEACLNLHSVYTALSDEKRAIESLFRSFLYAPPRSRACCHIGDYFFKRNEPTAAIYWYERALDCDNGEKSGAFVDVDYGGYIPLMQLCVLYDRLGDYALANGFNERAGKLKPHDRNYLSNKQYFQIKLNQEVKIDEKT